MIAKPNGDFCFPGPYGDTILLKTQWPIGQKWPYNTANNDSAYIQSRGIATFYGISDSVLDIVVTNGTTYQLSKNHGFLHWPFHFPIKDEQGILLMNEGDLFGIEELSFGRKIPRFEDLYAFDSGDKFMIWEDEFEFPTDYERTQHYTITSQLSSGSIVSYLAQKGRFENGTTYPPITDTLTIQENQLLKLLPGEGEIPTPSSVAIFYKYFQFYKTRADHNGRIAAYLSDYGVVDSCQKSSFRQREGPYGAGSIQIVLEGVGDLYTHEFYHNTFSFEFYWDYQERMVCYEKVNELWNGPCDMVREYVSIDAALNQYPALQIFPQPANASLSLRADAGDLPDGELQIVDLNGAIQYSTLISNQAEIQLETSRFPAGLYFLRMQAKDGRRLTTKIVIQH